MVYESGNSKYIHRLFFAYCKTQIRVLPVKCASIHYVIFRYMSFQRLVPSHLCPLLCHTQIYVFSKTYILRFVSSGVILRSMFSKTYVPSYMCPLTYTDQGNMSKAISPQICVLHIGDRE